MLRKFPRRRHVILFLGTTVATVALTFFMLITSESYEVAKEFVSSDGRIAQLTGIQKSSRLSPLKGFRSTFSERTGEAHFTFKVSGAQGSLDVRVALEKRDGRWYVIRAQATSSDGVITEVVGARL